MVPLLFVQVRTATTPQMQIIGSCPVHSITVRPVSAHVFRTRSSSSIPVQCSMFVWHINKVPPSDPVPMSRRLQPMRVLRSQGARGWGRLMPVTWTRGSQHGPRNKATPSHSEGSSCSEAGPLPSGVGVARGTGAATRPHPRVARLAFFPRVWAWLGVWAPRQGHTLA